MVPKTLEEWSLAALKDLLARGTFEGETFDFKEMLPDSKGEKAKGKLRATCAAFANSVGGFVVFGVSDNRKHKAEQRLVGIDKGEDLPEHFGAFPSGCTPSVYWSFMDTPLALEDGRVFHVIEVPPSWKAPHAVEQPGGEGGRRWLFPKRTNKGNEAMSMEEIRSAFLGFYEKRLKLQLLRAEVDAIRDTAESTEVREIGVDSVAIPPFDVSVIQSILGDTYSLTAERTKFHTALIQLRANVRIIDFRMKSILGILHLGMTKKQEIISGYNKSVRSTCRTIKECAVIAIRELDELLESKHV